MGALSRNVRFSGTAATVSPSGSNRNIFFICFCAVFACTATIASAQLTPAPAVLSKCHYSQKRASRSSDATPFKLEWDFTNTSEKIETEVDVTLYVARADDEAATGLTYQQKGS